MNEFLINYSKGLDYGKSKIGAKSFSVALLDFNNICVPRGLLVTTDFWNLFLKSKDVNLVEELVETIFNQLKCDKYIVRSSAVGEDSADCSWAGCFESISNVLTKEDMKNALIECGKSLRGNRYFSYKKMHNAVAPIFEISFLIQEYIDADISGVAFSANPVNGNKNEIVIEYQKGSSGSVVGGYGYSNLIFSKKSMPFKSANSCDVYVYNMIFPFIQKISKILDTYVDIEWVIKDDHVYITQARPITTL